VTYGTRDPWPRVHLKTSATASRHHPLLCTGVGDSEAQTGSETYGGARDAAAQAPALPLCDCTAATLPGPAAALASILARTSDPGGPQDRTTMFMLEVYTL
jgi:hypothetical protein